MRIAQISPLVFRVPPERFGGTERIVSYLTEGLIDQGHEVVLFASGDSQTRAQLVACSPQPINPADWQRRIAYHILMYEQVYRQAEQFDIIHNHTHLYGASLARRYKTPTVNTLHGGLQPENIWERKMFEEYRELPLTSLSQAQQAPFPWLNWIGTVYNGLPKELYSYHERPGSYLAFLGRIDPNKGLTDAIEIAKKTGLPLKIAGFTGFVPPSYWDEMKALMTPPLIEYIGEVDDAQKNTFLGQAAALLFPIQWDEPFGIVMIEALACGTPVIAYARGSVPEIISDGVNGFVVSSIAQAVAAVERLHTLSRRQCRASFEQHFTAQGMVQQYLALYTRLIQQAQ